MANAQAVLRDNGKTKDQNNVLKLANQLQNAGLIAFLVLLYIVVGIMNHHFVSYTNLSNVIVQTSILGVVSYGMTFAIAMGAFDLSVGSVQSLCACFVGTMLIGHGILTSIGATLLVGLVVGLINGIIVSKLKVPAFVATLGTMSLVRGVALLFTNGQSILISNQRFSAINAKSVLGIPIPFIIALILLFVMWAIFKHTPFGRHIAAVGGNPHAAVATGLKVDRIMIAVFAIVGVATAFSGILTSSQLMNVSGSLGVGLEMNAIAAVVLGGTSLDGGRGNLAGTLIGAFLLSSISNALNILNIPSFYQYLATGLLLIGALSLDEGRRNLVKSLLRRSMQ